MNVDFSGNNTKAFVDNWLAFARKEGVHPKVIAFIEENPDDLFPEDGPANPRKWVIVSNLMVSAFFEDCRGSVDTYYNVLVGAERYARFKQFTYAQ